MPIGSVKLRPGVNVQRTPTLNEAGFSQSQLIRFKDGLVQTMGGWKFFARTSLSSIGRCILSYLDLQNNVHTAVGCDNNLYSVTGNQGSATLQDITPRPYTINGVLCSTTSGSATVTLTGLNNMSSYITGASIFFVTPVSVGGLILQGGYAVASYISSSSVTIVASTTATATVTAGGSTPTYTSTLNSSAITVTFNNHGLSIGAEWNEQISTVIANNTIFGNYVVLLVIDANRFTIPVPNSSNAATTVSENGGSIEVIFYGPIPSYPTSGFTASYWTLDHFGQNLLACAGGPIFVWPPNVGNSNAQAIPQAPSVNGGIFVAMPAQILVAWASSINGVQQNNLVQWSDQLNYAQWTPLVTNQAGNFTIPTGSRIVGGIQAPSQALIWTDVDVYAMNYLGGQGGSASQLVFGFNKIATGCGLLGPRCMGVLNEDVYWLSQGQIMGLINGAVQTIPCPIWDVLYQNLNTAYVNKIVCAPNSEFTEIGWFFVSIIGGGTENDTYIKYNPSEGTWDYGSLSRSAWQDYSPAGPPLAVNSAAPSLVQHELGYTDEFGAAVNWSFSTGAFMLDEGNNIMFVDWMLPDWKYNTYSNNAPTDTITVTVDAFMYANDTPVNSNLLTCTPTGNGELALRLRGRSLTFIANGFGFMRLGNLRYRYAPDGKY